MRIKITTKATILSLFCVWGSIFAQTETPEQKTKRLQWFQDAKLGIFIHWGIYAVNGIDESWSFHNGYISHKDYMKQLDGFTASNYDPTAWASLFKQSGAKYAVLTTKHHDGVALWPTKMGHLDVVKDTPAGRDLVGPLTKELRKNDLKVGLYYSLLDWSHPDYPKFLKNKIRYKSDSLRWKKFDTFNHGQINEISRMYNPDLVWFDGDWEQSAEKWRAKEIREMLLANNPGIIINSRLQGYGDYATPEQGVPVARPKSAVWELCMTMNDSWGYQHNDHNYKSTNQIIRIFAECLSLGGNMLLDIGPKADGRIPDEQIAILKGLGRWTSKHADAIYGTRAGLPPGHFYGPTALSKDRQTLYLYLAHKPNGPIMLKGLKNKINRIWVVGNGTKLKWDVKMKQYWSSVPGLVYIDVPEQVLDQDVTVLAVLLKGPAEVYSEHVGAIESN